jgi:hypothetical protein
VSPPVAATGSRSGALGRLPRREARCCWATVVARHARDDWPPPEWLAAVTAEEGGSDPHEAPVLLIPAEERAA